MELFIRLLNALENGNVSPDEIRAIKADAVKQLEARNKPSDLQPQQPQEPQQPAQ